MARSTLVRKQLGEHLRFQEEPALAETGGDLAWLPRGATPPDEPCINRDAEC
jgi:hypothetical protein